MIARSQAKEGALARRERKLEHVLDPGVARGSLRPSGFSGVMPRFGEELVMDVESRGHDAY